MAKGPGKTNPKRNEVVQGAVAQRMPEARTNGPIVA